MRAWVVVRVQREEARGAGQGPSVTGRTLLSEFTSVGYLLHRIEELVNATCYYLPCIHACCTRGRAAQARCQH